jgi:hypothetical protein
MNQEIKKDPQDYYNNLSQDEKEKVDKFLEKYGFKNKDDK